MNFLVTGGAGFIGSHVVDRLVQQGHRVVVLDDFNDFYDPKIKRANLAPVLDRISLVEGDLRDRDKVKEAFQKLGGKVDVVIHLAARAGVRPSISHPELYISTNINGTFNILDEAKQAGVPRVIFASSSSVYGVNKKIPFSEEDRIERTISPYAATKLAGEQLCSNFAHLSKGKMRIYCLRFFTVYGPRQRPDLAISKFTRLISEGSPIDRYGDGSTSRDYTYVEDIVQGIFGAIEYDGPDFDIFNLGGSETTTLNGLIQAVESALGKKATINQCPEQPGDVPRTWADVAKSKSVLGYSPNTPISAGVPKYVEWYLQMKSAAA